MASKNAASCIRQVIASLYSVRPSGRGDLEESELGIDLKPVRKEPVHQHSPQRLGINFSQDYPPLLLFRPAGQTAIELPICCTRRDNVERKKSNSISRHSMAGFVIQCQSVGDCKAELAYSKPAGLGPSTGGRTHTHTKEWRSFCEPPPRYTMSSTSHSAYYSPTCLWYRCAIALISDCSESCRCNHGVIQG